MIPKIIHYCWLSEEKYPEVVRLCMDSWKRVLPDYRIKRWDTHNFDIDSISFVKEAFGEKKWAFAADYIRLYALFEEGGIYLDSDVFVKESFDSLLENRAFSCIEYNKQFYPEALSNNIIDRDGNVLLSDRIDIPGLQVQAAVIGCEKGNAYIRDCMKYYESQHFVLSDGSLNDKVLAPDILACCARKYGLKYVDKQQDLGVIKIYPSEVVAAHPSLMTGNSLAIHYCTGSWRKKTVIRKLVDWLRQNILLRIRVIR